MRILIGWDNPAEADLLRLCPAAADNEVEVALGPEDRGLRWSGPLPLQPGRGGR